MAKIETVSLVDDLDGGEASESVSFALDGRHREIDLSTENAARLRDLLGPFVAASRAVAGRAPSKRAGAGESRSTSDRAHNQRVRAWARENGHEVNERGRIPAEVLDAYARSAA